MVIITAALHLALSAPLTAAELRSTLERARLEADKGHLSEACTLIETVARQDAQPEVLRRSAEYCGLRQGRCDVAREHLERAARRCVDVDAARCLSVVARKIETQLQQARRCPCALQLKTRPADAVAQVDGRPLPDDGISGGLHRLVVVAAGHQTARRQLRCEGMRPIITRVTLAPVEPKPTPPTPTNRWRAPTGWGLIAVGAASAGLATWYGIKANDGLEQTRAAVDAARAQGGSDSALRARWTAGRAALEENRPLAYLAAGVGAAALVGAGYCLWPRAAPGSARLDIGPAGAAVHVQF